MIIITIRTSTVRIILACHLYLLITPQRQLRLVSDIANRDLSHVSCDPFLLLRVPAEGYWKSQRTYAPRHHYYTPLCGARLVSNYQYASCACWHGNRGIRVANAGGNNTLTVGRAK